MVRDDVARITFAGLPAQTAVCNAGGHETAMAEYVLLGMLSHAHDWLEATHSFKADGAWRMSGRQGGPMHGELSRSTVYAAADRTAAAALKAEARSHDLRIDAASRSDFQGRKSALGCC